MSTIRRQSIISSFVVYLGFALGLLNTYLFARQGGLTVEQFGLTNTFIAFATIMFSIASVGTNSFIAKFFPYYKAHVPDNKNDQLTWAILFACAGFVLVLIAGIILKPIVFKVFANSPELPRYYYWVFLFGFGFTLFSVMEAYAWQHRKAVLSNFLKEVLFRFFVTILIVFATIGVIKGLGLFIRLYSFTYLALALILIFYFYKKKQLHFTLTKSTVTKKFFKKIVAFASFVWSGNIVMNIATVFDGIVIAAVLPNGMASAGVYYLAQNVSGLMQAPQRAIISSAIGPLSQAWKDKDYAKLNRIYHRSSINQLIFACAMFALIWLNFDDGISTFHLKPEYAYAKWIFFFIGMAKIIDMGTGLNGHIIATSTLWRFDFFTGLILMAMTIPMNYFLTKEFYSIGTAASNLITFSIYNTIRYLFLLKKFKMQPFDLKTLYTIILAATTFFICFWLFDTHKGFGWIVLRSSVFTAIFGTGMFLLKLTPDAMPVLITLKKKLGFNS
ncbi:MAG TPA: oligosaccharide flippase family protein [Flavisolibacter sp.]|jgi:O-antigen/teichoic acid export membrane protein|nr:oligosaccharide flippase family protein [Flavisolibacter sp.]